VALTVTSYSGALAAFANHMGATAWPINKYKQSLLDLYDPNDIVVMSPDAQEPLPTIDPSKVYVIGGIVDKTVQKGLTKQFAQHHNLASYRLPIQEYAGPLGLDFPGANLRPILTATDVVTALLIFHATHDWATALNDAVPLRKRRRPA
jgi:tRNA (guanine9-N1)-methyltransferase